MEYLKIERPGQAAEIRGPYKSEAYRAAARLAMLKTPGTVCTVTDENKKLQIGGNLYFYDDLAMEW